MSKICVGITSYNCLPYLKNNIESLQRTSENLSIIVIDNGSSDGTQNWLRNSKLNYSLNSFNPYASYGCFQSIAYFLTQTHADYFLHLDPDAQIIKPTALSEAIQQLDRGSVGCIGEKRYALRYHHPKSRSLKAFDQWIMSEWSYPGPLDRCGREKVLLEKHPTEDYMVYKELCGNVMFFKREVIQKIGNIDIERFKMWRWDSEYSMRCLFFDYDIEEAEVVKNGSIKHFGGRTRLRVSNKQAYDMQVLKDLRIRKEDLDKLYLENA